MKAKKTIKEKETKKIGFWSNIKSSKVILLIKKIRQSLSGVGFAFLFDVLFFIVAYFLAFLFNDILVPITGEKLVYRLIYLTVMLAIFSATSFLSLDALSVYSGKKTDTDYKRMPGFFALIIMIFMFGIMVFSLINLAAVKLFTDENSLIIFLQYAYLIIFLALYPFAMISQSYYIKGKSAWKSIIGGGRGVFTKIKDYYPLAMILIVQIFCMAVIFTLIDMILRASINQEVLIGFYPNFITGLVIVSLALFYKLHMLSRAYFLEIIVDEK